VGKALQVDDADILKLRKRRVHSSVDVTSAKDTTSSAKKGRRSNSIDDHNEVCEVCDKGGDLLCCDTCTLVFHLKCLRPKLSIVPKGRWSCPHCIIDVCYPFQTLIPPMHPLTLSTLACAGSR
jgi:hypothetical protein